MPTTSSPGRALSPYRSPAGPFAKPDEGDIEAVDTEFWPLYVAWWAASAMRVSVPLAKGDALDGEGALAAIVVVLLPLMLRATIASTIARQLTHRFAPDRQDGRNAVVSSTRHTWRGCSRPRVGDLARPGDELRVTPGSRRTGLR